MKWNNYWGDWINNNGTSEAYGINGGDEKIVQIFAGKPEYVYVLNQSHTPLGLSIYSRLHVSTATASHNQAFNKL